MQKTSIPLGNKTLLFASLLVVIGMVISVVALSAGGWTMLALVYGVMMAAMAIAAVLFYRMA